MGHHIKALLGTNEALKNFVTRLGTPVPTALSFGLVIIPLDEQRLDAIAMSVEPTIEGFAYLTPRMAQEIAVTVSGPALYLETDYFGGAGGQSAAYFDNGKLTWWRAESSEEAQVGPLLADSHERTTSGGKSPINEGLSKLGVGRSEVRDEFDEIGLPQFRSLEALGIEYDDQPNRGSSALADGQLRGGNDPQVVIRGLFSDPHHWPPAHVVSKGGILQSIPVRAQQLLETDDLSGMAIHFNILKNLAPYETFPKSENPNVSLLIWPVKFRDQTFRTDSQC